MIKPLNKSLVEIMLRRMELLSRSEEKSNSNLTYVIGDPMKSIHKDENKLIIIL